MLHWLNGMRYIERKSYIMLRYRLEGSGATPLLLIHGWGVTYSIWQNLAPLLTPYFQLIMIELPGVGGSPETDPQKPYYEACAEAIDEVRYALGIEQWSLLAYSAGTRAAEAYVRRYPQTITRAVLLCPVYLPEIWSFFLRLLDTPHPQTLNEWVLSDWRLHNLIRVLGFNWQRNDYTYVWKNEIELQPVNVLLRSLCEIPGRGRAPFDLHAVPTLFVWGRRDAITAKPRRPRPNDILIPANHSAPMLAAHEVASAVLPFLTTGELSSAYNKELPTSTKTSTYAAWRIWRNVRYKREKQKQSIRSRKEIRLMKRLSTIRTVNLDEVGEKKETIKKRGLLGQRRKKALSTTNTTRKRLFLRSDSESYDTTTSKKRHFLRSNPQKDHQNAPEKHHFLRRPDRATY
jgi:pimeloyl-ACP methyl ester carboxylesterase